MVLFRSNTAACNYIVYLSILPQQGTKETYQRSQLSDLKRLHQARHRRLEVWSVVSSISLLISQLKMLLGNIAG